MDLRKVIVAASLLAIAGAASVLDTNDVKMNTTMGLGGNPAAIAVNAKSKVEVGSIIVNNTAQSHQILNTNQPIEDTPYHISFYDGKNINSSSFNDASRFLSYTDVWKDNWFSIRYAYESNLYPNLKTKIDTDAISNLLVGMGAGALLPTTGLVGAQDKASMTMYRKDAVEKVSFLWARKLNESFTGGIELATNIYTLNDNKNFNKTAEDLNFSAVPGIGAILGKPFQDTNSYSQSGSYYTLTLGGIYDIADNQKISLSHKFSQDRGVYAHMEEAGKPFTQYSYIESIPNETGLAYIYNPMRNLELAAVFKTFWGLTYDRNYTHSDDPESTETYTLLPSNSYGFAASYTLNDDFAFQGYGNYLRNYKAYVVSGPNGADEKGYNVSQLGGNVQYSPAFLGGGIVSLGSYINRLAHEDPAVGNVFDITNTVISYNHAFDSLFTPTIRPAN